jgi:hypothetical protein
MPDIRNSTRAAAALYFSMHNDGPISLSAPREACFMQSGRPAAYGRGHRMKHFCPTEEGTAAQQRINSTPSVPRRSCSPLTTLAIMTPTGSGAFICTLLHALVRRAYRAQYSPALSPNWTPSAALRNRRGHSAPRSLPRLCFGAATDTSCSARLKRPVSLQ